MQDKKEESQSRGYKLSPKKNLTRDLMIDLVKALEETSRAEMSLDEEINIILEELAYFASINEFQNALIALNRLASQIKHFSDEGAFFEFLKNETEYSVINTPQVAYFFALMNDVIKNQNKLLISGSQEDKNIDDQILPFCFLSNSKKGLKILTPLLSPHRVGRQCHSEFNNDVAKLDSLFNSFRVYKEYWRSDRYFYRLANHLPKWDSLYIESFHDIFDDIADENYINYILNNIQQRLKICKEHSFPAFIHFNTDNVHALFLKISHYLGNDNLIQKKIEEQINSGAKMRSFNQECQRAGSKTLLLGGTYGNGCVLAAAQKLGKTIFTKTNGYFQASHAHCRWVNYHKKPYLYENSLIDPQITEGFNPFDAKQNVEKIGFSEFPALLRVSHRYKCNFLASELEQVRVLDALPREQQRKLIFSECVDYSKLATVKPSALSRIRQRSAQLNTQSVQRPILSWVYNGSRPTVILKKHRKENSEENPSPTQNMTL
ncbi:hypothetical protein [Legionella bozemanae]|uniref:hypothetical protein n=1 Tax=Legionella bozemanae TaxID=447 RepID=UPI00399CECB2